MADKRLSELTEADFEVVEMDPADYTVAAYDTGDRLEGAASANLVTASLTESSGTGAVNARCDEQGVWRLVDPSRTDDMRRMGHEVVTVYVER